jgi:long-chain fatty acid transport protein
MKKKITYGFIRVYCTIAFSLVIAGGTARAGGLGLYEFGSPDVGLAAAGYAARAQDAATVFTNPAGMSFLDKSQVLGALQGLYGDVGFSPDSGTTVKGSDGGTAIGWAPGGSLFATQKLNKDWSLGFGVLSYFGLSEKYDDDWVGRYYVQKSSLLGLTLTPALSYRVNDWISVGAGLNMMYGYIDDQVAVNNVGDLRADGQLKYKDTEWGYGGNFGILAEPMAGTRFGLTYLTEVKLDFSAVPEFSGLGPILQSQLNKRGLTTNNLELDMTVPQMVMFSANQNLNEKWSILGNLGWQNWSRFGQVEIGVNSTNPESLTVDSDYNDTWHAALGTQYRHSQEWTFSGGVAYDSSAVDDDKRSVVVPMGEAWRFALGTQYALTSDITLGAAYEFIWSGDMSVDQYRGPLAGRVAGDYNSSNFSFLALNIIWKY